MVTKICVVGLGYVGVPLALELSKHFEVTGFDNKKDKIQDLRQGKDRTGEINGEVLKNSKIYFTDNPEKIKENNFIIVCVPTPIDENKKPDLSYLEDASEIIGKNLARDSIVVYESTVYPGVTEEICAPVIEKSSGLKCGTHFKIGYSPERINPGDKEHAISKIVKVVAGMDQETLKKIDSVYSKITKTHKVSSIKVAEAAKVIENIQRDLNIALMNELAIIFDKMDIDVNQVLEAAETKWNFHKYYPGLVGGHCIGVDPYYLTFKAEELGYNPQVILAGRRINDDMHKFYAEKIIERLEQDGKKPKNSKVLLLGLTFKPDVKDHRNSRIKHLIKELKEKDVEVFAHDPILTDRTVEEAFMVENKDFKDIVDKVDLVVLSVDHSHFKEIKEKYKDIFNLKKIK